LGFELGASDALDANTKQDYSDSSNPSEHGNYRGRETAPLRLLQQLNVAAARGRFSGKGAVSTATALAAAFTRIHKRVARHGPNQSTSRTGSGCAWRFGSKGYPVVTAASMRGALWKWAAPLAR
jgi:hypothetical protein